MADERCSHQATDIALAAGHLLQLFGIPGTLQRNPGSGFLYFTEIVGRESY
jgi:hypothetical protein